MEDDDDEIQHVFVANRYPHFVLFMVILNSLCPKKAATTKLDKSLLN